MTDSEDTQQETPHMRRPYKRIRPKDSWLRDRHDSTPAEAKQWNDAGMPPHIDIVGSFLASNDFVFGIPDKAELYRLDALTRESEKTFGSPELRWQDSLRLHYVEPSPLPYVSYTMAHRPLGLDMSDIVEVNYNVRLQAIVRQMRLMNVRVVHEPPAGSDFGLVFEGTDFHGPAVQHQLRVIRITTLVSDIGKWETMAKTTYPKSII